MRALDLCLLRTSAALAGADDAILGALRESARELKQETNQTAGEAMSLALSCAPPCHHQPQPLVASSRR